MDYLNEEMWSIGREIVSSAPQLYVDVEIEADGKPGQGFLLAIGALSPTGEEFYANFSDSQDANGARNESPASSEVARAMHSFREWVLELKDFYGKETVFTAFHAAFNWSHVDLAMLKSGIYENPFGEAPLDLQSLSLPLNGRWDFCRTRSNELPAEILPKPSLSHQALEEARYQQKIHYGLAAYLGRASYLAAMSYSY